MNVDEAMARWKRVREMYDWPVFPPTAMDVVVAEVERLRAELADWLRDRTKDTPPPAT